MDLTLLALMSLPLVCAGMVYVKNYEPVIVEEKDDENEDNQQNQKSEDN